METKSKFDGLVVKYNNSSLSGHSDCSLCCLNCMSCEGCPLQGNYYFEKSPVHAKAPSSVCMSDSDKSKIDDVINDLFWLADNLKSSRDLNLLFYSTIRMSITDLELQLNRLSSIKTFDK